MYHRVVDDEKYAGVYDTHVTLENFEKQMKYIKDNGYETITFEDIANEEYKNRFNNKKYVVITFDDGYKDNLKNALPILKKYNLKKEDLIFSEKDKIHKSFKEYRKAGGER